jgi:ubiquinone/menaquinone biosynthesis C-methylase UbiE
VLDLGCGTGTLTILTKQRHPESEVVGLDGDPKILEIARAKAQKAGIDIAFQEGMAFQLPYPDGSFDRVLCSLVLHHLTTENKRRTLKEVYRVLRYGGEFHVADFGKPGNFPAYLISLIIRLFEDVMDNIKGLLPKMFAQAGLSQVEETAQYMTIAGTLALYKARKPD